MSDHDALEQVIKIAWRTHIAEEKLRALTALVRPSRKAPLTPPGSFGFNEWFRAQDGSPAGEDWQTWSASMYLYATACVDAGEAMFFGR
jgi:hypothetical protein